MPVENATKISELVDTNPTGADSIARGDDHLRMLKRVLKAAFNGVDVFDVKTQAEYDALANKDAKTIYVIPVDQA